jgi:phospholipid/cholesterol/gamma-HCH transport system ATP-binding protein
MNAPAPAPAPAAPADASAPPGDGPVIEVSGLVNRFGRQVVHDGLSMVVHPGEIFCILGGSGSGKSVLLRTILGLRRPQAGIVKLHGHDIKDMSEAEMRAAKARYGVTFQEGALFSSLTVLQNLQLPMLEHLTLSPSELEQRALVKLGLVGLPPESAQKYPAQLSGGMIKRAALARSLALDPPLLFLDEPTSGLDPIGAASFDELVLELQGKLKLTIVMITHDLDTIFRTCNRVGVIVDRRMVSGTLAEIVQHPHPWIQAYFHGERGQRFVPAGGLPPPVRGRAAAGSARGA